MMSHIQNSRQRGNLNLPINWQAIFIRMHPRLWHMDLFKSSEKFQKMLNGWPKQSQTFMYKRNNVRAINIRALLQWTFV